MTRAKALIAAVLALSGCRTASTRVVVFDVVEREFVMDMCAGGRLTPDLGEAAYYHSKAEARDAVRAADLDSDPLLFVEVP